MVFGAFVARLNVAIGRVEAMIAAAFWRGPRPELCLAYDLQSPKSFFGPDAANPPKVPTNKLTIKDILGDGFLWAVPKSRRSLEKRLKRKFGHPDYVLKILKPTGRIRTCNTCGDDHLVGVLCPTCYKKVIDETKEMQEAIQNELKLAPVENEVVVLYEGERDKKSDEYWQGKRIVEMAKSRPKWFSKNLEEQTTQQPATTSDVKPTDLG